MNDSTPLHIVMLPWLAMGHLLPFLELSKCLARRGHRISYLATPSNIKKLLPNIPTTLSNLHLVELRMPNPNPLPDHVENTSDLPSEDLRHHLNTVYNSFQPQLSTFLDTTRPDWVIYDYAAAGWASTTAADYAIPSTMLSLFTAATSCFFGGRPGAKARKSPEDFTKVPDWIPFPTTIAYRPYEARELFMHMVKAESTRTSSAELDANRFLAIRSCNEFEEKWLQLLGQINGTPGTPVVPVGLLPPSASSGESWDGPVSSWLDQQQPRSVVYVAFDSEVKLTNEQVNEVALGLELCGLPFLWALKTGLLPEGFEVRTSGKGLVCRGWVEQNRILGHASVGGFLTHGGWNSIVEGLSFGVALMILPFVFDQGLNARNMTERRIGVEVVRDDDDGSFTGEAIANSLRLVMVEEEGEGFRKKAEEWKKVFGDEELQDKCVGDFVKYFLEHRLSSE